MPNLSHFTLQPNLTNLWEHQISIAMMDRAINETHDELVAKLITGFEAMLEQVQVLARRNSDLEERLGKTQETVSLLLISSDVNRYEDTP